MGTSSLNRAAFAFKPRIGRAVLVALAGTFREPRVIERLEIPLLPPGEFAPYHAAEGLKPDAAARYVEESIGRARRLATSAVGDAAKRCADAGLEVCGCGVLVGTGMPDWTAAEILAVHVRMHKAEGEMFRDLLVEAAGSCGIGLTTLPDKTVFDAAAKRLGVTRARLDEDLAAMGKAAGPPWGKFQKEAAAAALVVLKHGKGCR